MVTKKDWITALPRYKRGQGFFRSLTDEYCPLGILADLIVKEGSVSGLSWEKGEESYLLVSPDGTKHAYAWPTELRMLTNVSIEAYHLARYNDSDDRNNADSAINSKDPWEKVGEWMSKPAGKGRAEAIPEFDTRSK